MKDLEKQLNNCETVAQMLTLLLTAYDTNIKPGLIVKPILIKGLLQAAIMLNLKPKKNERFSN